MSFFVYILYSPSLDKYYVGSCENMDIRLQQHNAGYNKSTKPGKPWQLKFTQTFDTRAAALQQEMAIKKKKSRKYIVWLIDSVG